MRKLFLLLTAVLLSAGMVVQAQLLDDGKDDVKRPDMLQQATHPIQTPDDAVSNSVSNRRNISTVSQPLGTWCAVKYGQANHTIESKIVYYNNGDWDYSSPADQFVKVQAYDASKSSNNYIVLFFWTQHTQDYNGKIGPEAGEYTMQSANVTYGTWGWAWTVPSNVWGIKVIDYSYIESVKYSRYGSWYPGLCAVSSAAGNYAGSISNTTMTTAFSNATIYVQVGKGGNMFVNVDTQGRPWFTIGEPYEYKVKTTATHGGITVTDNTNNRTFSTLGTHSVFYEGTSLTFTPTNADPGYQFSSWTHNGSAAGNDNPMNWTVEYGDQDGSDIINIGATFTPINYSITYNQNGGSGASNGTYTVESGAITLPTAATMTKAGYTFAGWYANSDLSTGGVVTTIPAGSTGNKTFWAKWTPNTYYVAFVAGEGSGTAMSNQTFTYGVAQNLTANSYTGPAVTVTYDHHNGCSTTSTTVNAPFDRWEESLTEEWYDDKQSVSNLTTTNGATVTMTALWGSYPSVTLPTPEKTGYTFNGWYTEETGGTKKGNGGASFNPAGNINLHAQWAANKHNVSWVTDGNALTGTYTNGTTAYGTTIVAPETPTKDATAQYTYTFNGWIPAVDATMPDNDVTYTATYSTTKVQYTLAWDVNGGNELTGTYTSGTIDWGTAITKPAAPTKAGYTFNGWDADNDDTADDVAATMPTSDVTYKALWNAISSDLVLKDGVSDGQTDINFDEFAATYNDQTMNTVTLNRTFTAGNWSTLCLPFNAPLSSSALKGNMFEFQHAHGNAQEGGGIYLYFSTATQIVAGRAYLVRFSKAPVSNSYTFTGFDGVKIDTDRDKSTLADLVAANTGENANQTEGTISLIGTLRKFVLPTPSANYMALYNNKIYYPGTNTTVPAYRAFFYDSNPASVQQRVRIVVDGVDMGEMLIDNGELLDAGGDDRAPRKYIRNGVLVIECNGVTYDAQGKRM